MWHLYSHSAQSICPGEQCSACHVLSHTSSLMASQARKPRGHQGLGTHCHGLGEITLAAVAGVHVPPWLPESGSQLKVLLLLPGRISLAAAAGLSMLTGSSCHSLVKSPQLWWQDPFPPNMAWCAWGVKKAPVSLCT